MIPGTVTRIHQGQFSDERLSKEYRDSVRNAGKQEGAFILIDTERLNALKRQYGRPLPPIATQLANAANAATRALIAAAAQKQVLADEATVAIRQEACQSCLELRDNRCARCGCYYATKIRLETEHCPLGKW